MQLWWKNHRDATTSNCWFETSFDKLQNVSCQCQQLLLLLNSVSSL